jgi:hypothetical protein
MQQEFTTTALRWPKLSFETTIICGSSFSSDGQNSTFRPKLSFEPGRSHEFAAPAAGLLKKAAGAGQNSNNI